MSFRWVDFCVRFPVIGLLARESKNVEKGQTGWYSAEEKLCAAYKKYVSLVPENVFTQRIEYMRNTGDLGRSPMSFGLKLFLFLLVAAEAMGFSYVLGTWAASEGSANLYTQLMYGIVFVLASILAIITHNAGSQYYRTSLIRSCFKRYRQTEGKEYSSRRVALIDDQLIDNKESEYTRCLNRVIEKPHDLGSYAWSWVAGAFILAIFVLSFVVRVAHMEGELNRQAQVSQASGAGNPFAATTLPADVAAPQKEADKKAQVEERASTQMEGVAAILMLSFIFLVTQVVGFGAGYKHCFAGKETYKKANGSNSFWFWSQKDGAYADTGGFSTYDSYWRTFQPLKDVVNARLKELQHRLKINIHENIPLTKMFDDYLHEQELRSRPVTPVAPAPMSAPASVLAPVPVQVTHDASAPEPSKTPLEKIKADISALTDKEAQKNYVRALPVDVQDALKPWLKQRKEEEKAKTISEAELDDLF